MISYDEIEQEIAILENETPTHAVMERLAHLYVVKEHIQVEHNSDTEFANLIVHKDYGSVMAVMDELMTTLAVLQPKLYEATMMKLKG